MNDLISRSALKKEIESLRVMVTGLRSGKGVLAEYAKHYKESVLELIDEAPTVEALEKQAGIERALERLEELIPLFDDCNSQMRYERYCKPKNKKCKDINCFACVLGEAIEILKEEVG